MSGGMTPYDKQSYKDSKKRRRQAKIADETGRILPFNFARRRAITAVCVAAACALLIVGGCFAYSYFANRENVVTRLAVSDESNEDLLRVVNKSQPLDSDYVPKLKKLEGIEVNALMYDDLLLLLSIAEADGVNLSVKSAYVSYEEQQEMYEKTLAKLLEDSSYTLVRAQAKAQKITPQGGMSEAQTGLLVEFDTTDKAAQSYLERVCVNYGFVLRYPEDKEGATSMEYNPTLYRYVGSDSAVKMRSYNMCLEEYNSYLAVQKSES